VVAASTDNSDILDDAFDDDGDDSETEAYVKHASLPIDDGDPSKNDLQPSDPALDEFETMFEEAHPELNDEQDGKFEKRKFNPYKPQIASDSTGSIPVQRNSKVDNVDDAHVAFHDTFFYDAFSEMRRQGFFSSDKDLLARLSITILDTFKRQASMQMVIDDIGNSITSLGVDTKFDYQALLKDMISLLTLQTTSRMIDDVGLDKYKDDIMLRLIESYYGQTGKFEREGNNRRRIEDESRIRVEHRLSDLTKTLKEMSKDFKHVANASTKPAKQSVFMHSHSKAFLQRAPANDANAEDYTNLGGDVHGDSR
jgi:hypothetical protein